MMRYTKQEIDNHICEYENTTHSNIIEQQQADIVRLCDFIYMLGCGVVFNRSAAKKLLKEIRG